MSTPVMGAQWSNPHIIIKGAIFGYYDTVKQLKFTITDTL